MRQQFSFLVLAAIVLHASALYLGIAVGGNHFLLLKTSSIINSWGSGDKGQLGNGVISDAPSQYPENMVMVPQSAGKVFMQVQASTKNSYAITTDGNILACGYQGPNGLLGRPDFIGLPLDSNPYMYPVNMTYMAGHYPLQISAKKDHVLIMTQDKIFAWGVAGPLGNVDGEGSPLPIPVDGNAMNGKFFKAVAAGGSHSIVLCTDGTMFAFGSNKYGQLGTGEFTDANVNLPVAMNLTALNGAKVRAIAAGEVHTVLLTETGKVYSMGLNFAGQLGDGTNTNRNLPTSPASNTVMVNTVIVSIAATYHSTLALTDSGILIVWGDYKYFPTLAPAYGGSSKIVQIAANANAALIVTADDDLYQYATFYNDPTKVEFAPPAPPAPSSPSAPPAPSASPSPIPLASEEVISSSSVVKASWASAMITFSVIIFALL